MDFSKLAEFSVGLAAFLGGLWIVLQIIKAIRQNGLRHNHAPVHAALHTAPTSGQQSPEFWQMTIRKIVEQAVADGFKGRNEEITRIVRQAVHDELGRH